MKMENTPVTGKENKDELSPMLRALSQFYEALNSRDMELMSQNWLQGDEAAMDNPLGGIKRGWEEIRSVYERLFGSTSNYYFEFYDYTLHDAGELFYVVGRERGTFKTGDTVLEMRIRTSRIFRLINGQWRQVHHHGSIEEPELLASYQQAVLGRREADSEHHRRLS
ncbi:YybH family protein [Geomonas anaerohicana]|uniref:Nuclear transport factor 2 family protein n=1 Tax=Geomonas anaerohicana TaxID=2798583 RepID=A0ABS0YBW4_9BACT|nr:nuclear transport factor 2 family protein [Geomonas anaerohicana]MBJ6749419.1 nuclear transport factor 2 family protein [Geomonas anaerohicana]